MNGESQPPSAVFVVTAWVEATGTPHVRARVRYTTQADGGQQVRVAAVTSGQVCRLLEAWWDALAAEDGGAPGPAGTR